MPMMNVSVSRGLDVIEDPLIARRGVPINPKQRLTSNALVDKSWGPDVFLLEIDHAIRKSPSMYVAVTVNPDVVSIPVGKDGIARHAVEGSIQLPGDLAANNTRGNLSIESRWSIDAGQKRIHLTEIELFVDAKGFLLSMHRCTGR